MTPPRDPDDDEFDDDELVPPEPCPACRGSGWVPGGPGEDDTVECPLCGATGVE